MIDNRPSWEIREEREIIEQRKLINEKIFIGDKDKTFATYDPNYNSHAPQMQMIVNFLLSPNERRLILKGDVGRGKTHLAQACKNYCDKHDERAEIISARRLYLLYRELEGFDCDWIYEKAMKRIWASGVFIIDDLGNEKQTDTQVFNQNFIELLDEFEGKIIVTTNLSEKDMENIYGTKIVSRIYDNAIVIVLSGKDHRRNG
jgi:DNA replication protein DnaC